MVASPEAGMLDNARTQAVLAALAFAGLEVLLQLTLRQPLARRLAASNKATGRGRGSKAAQADAATAMAKIVGSVHNLIQIPCALSLLRQGDLGSVYTIRDTSPAGQRLVAITAGYFLYDLLQVALRWEQEGPAYLLHALACLSVYGYSTLSGYLQYYGPAFVLWELSTPFVHGRWFLYKLGLEDTRLYLANGLAMTVTFFAARCVWGTYVSARFWADTGKELLLPPGVAAMSPGVVWCARAANVALTSLNFYWFWLMARKAVAVLGGKRASDVHTGKED